MKRLEEYHVSDAGSNADRQARNQLARPLLDALHECRLLLDQLRVVALDRDAYRVLARETLHALAEVTEQLRRQSERYHRLLDERRSKDRAV